MECVDGSECIQPPPMMKRRAKRGSGRMMVHFLHRRLILIASEPQGEGADRMMSGHDHVDGGGVGKC